jgi:DNA invertase Pin-like site-specific DNA recombinase
MSKSINVTDGNKTREFENPSQLAKALLSETFLPLSAIASACDISPQTVYRIEETYGIRAEANPKYARA